MGGTGPARRPGPEPVPGSASVHAMARDGSTPGRQGDAPMAPTRPAPASFGRLIRIADRLRELPAGTAAADAAIHPALRLPGEPRPYTTDETALRTLLPEGFGIAPSRGRGRG